MVHPLNGIVTPNWCSSSRSPWRGTNPRFWLVTNCRSGPDAVRRGGALMAVEAPKDPMQFGDSYGSADARASRVLDLCFATILSALKMAIPCRDGCPVQVIPSPSSAKNLSRRNSRGIRVYIGIRIYIRMGEPG